MKDRYRRWHRWTLARQWVRSLLSGTLAEPFLTLDESMRRPDGPACPQCDGPTYLRDNDWQAACARCKKVWNVKITLRV